jgi:ATP-dependent exoDNAse (exonuclease V) beta subunit
LDAKASAIEALARLHGKLMGASQAEVKAAIAAVVSALAHEVFVEAREAKAKGQCHREWPMVHHQDDDSYLEGVADLVYKDMDDCWVVVDFKTDGRLDDDQQYHTQVKLYCQIIGAATGESARGLLLAV